MRRQDALPGSDGTALLTVLVDNQPGVLSRISGLLSSRGFNIQSLVVSESDLTGLSRMTIVLCDITSPQQLKQAFAQLEDLPQVWAVVDYT